MLACTLLVSHPPHGTVDAAQAAPHLNLAPPDVALKVNYPIPEIWAVEEDARRVGPLADALRHAGLRLSLVPGEALTSVPPQAPIQAVSLTQRGAMTLFRPQPVDLSSDRALVGVHYTPRAVDAESRGGRSREIHERGAACDAPFLDLYLRDGDRTERLTAQAEVTDFSGLGTLKSPSSAGQLARFAQAIEERFPGRLDRRLVNMQTRHWPPPSTLSPTQAMRKGFSFASVKLAELLGNLDPELANVSHCEFASRLVYLTHRFEG